MPHRRGVRQCAARWFTSVTVLSDGGALVTGGYAEAGDGLPSSAQEFVYRPK
jgi:hypothetical protein